jgi:uncharacterized protein (TIGR03435 family)
MIGPRTLAWLLLYSTAAFGQASEKKLEFDVASVRVSTPPGPQMRGMRGGPGSNDPTRFTVSFTNFQGLLIYAYGLRYDQIAGPPWQTAEYYDITAKVPEGATKTQFQDMFQNLLLDRFNMTVHFEKRDFTAYELTVAKGGLKMKEFVPDPKAPEDRLPNGMPVYAPLSFKDGFPVLAPGNSPALGGIDVNGRMLYTARQRSIDDIAERVIESALALQNGQAPGSPGGQGVRVVDKTGLTGKYDFHLQFAQAIPSLVEPNPPPGADYLDSISEPAPDIAAAVQQQLGLTLTKGKVTVDVLVIDHAEKVPTDN